MAPCNRIEELDNNNMGKELRKLRKPAIEKMRRDRINNSIEQLRLLLEKEFQKHLSSKSEKADVLEMTVSLLRQQLHKATKAVAPCKPAFPTSIKETNFLPNNKYTSLQTGYWSDSIKFSSTKENVCHPLATFNQGVKQAAQACGAVDLWRPW